MPTKRIEYIDAMRGFTMLLVVYSHIVFLGIHLHSFTFNHFFCVFRMPLFFFISGWVMYKASREWNLQEVKRFLGNKFMVQIIPTVFFLSLFIWVFHVTNTKQWFDVGKLGYWFTYTLFQYFLFYVLSVTLVPKKYKKTKVEDAIVIAIAILITFISLCGRLYLIKDKVLVHYIGSLQWYYYLFFCFGTLVKKYYTSFIRLTDNKWVMAVIIISMIVLAVVNEKLDYLSSIIPNIFLSMLCIVTILTYFRKNERHFSKDKPLGKALQYIGRRTLDIYLLHYFFLPRNLQVIGKFFNTYNNPTVEFFVCLVFALMVIGLALLISNIIRLSPFLAHYLFGVKDHQPS